MKGYLLAMTIAGAFTSCSPQERQDLARDVTRVAVHAAAMDLIEYCKPNDTVADCIDKLIELGIREIKLLPQDGGKE